MRRLGKRHVAYLWEEKCIISNTDDILWREPKDSHTLTRHVISLQLIAVLTAARESSVGVGAFVFAGLIARKLTFVHICKTQCHAVAVQLNECQATSRKSYPYCTLVSRHCCFSIHSIISSLQVIYKERICSKQNWHFSYRPQLHYCVYWQQENTKYLTQKRTGYLDLNICNTQSFFLNL